MTQSGKYLLRSIQNESMPKIDLLIRECLQNSLDAAVSRNKGEKVFVDIQVGSCETKKINALFDGLTKELNKRFTSVTVDYISLRDSNTVGLTGPLKEEDIKEEGNYGNLRKLVYDFGQPQAEENSGGSWGIGKTVCYRIGIGIVIYYSRIKLSENKFESRLAAMLIEDETSPKSLLRSAGLKNGNTSKGIAWWGNEDINGSSYPITDEDEIAAILKDLQIQAYTADETGTTIIIPYIDQQALEINANPYGTLQGKLKDYIGLAVQRWYFPRLYNKEYEFGAYLEFTINGYKIRGTKIRPYFQEMQKLYNITTKAILNDNQNVEKPSDIYIAAIDMNSTFSDGRTAGFVAYKKYNEAELSMLPPNNEPQPYTLLLRDDDDDDTGNMPVIAYCRQAGMVINYEINSAWTHGMPKLTEGEFLLGFFQPNGKKRLKKPAGMSGIEITLDEYLRSTERADHSNWEDKEVYGKKQRIIEKIQKNLPKKIAATYEESAEERKAKADQSLQRNLGKAFLPPSGFGKAAPVRPKTPGKPPATPVFKTHNLSFKLEDMSFSDNGSVCVPFSMTVKNGLDNIHLYLKAHTSQQEIDPGTWEKDIGSNFPAVVLYENLELYLGKVAYTSVEPVCSSKHVCYGIHISQLASCYDAKGKITLQGKLYFKHNDPTISIRVVAEEGDR